jgi:putative CRISPR-associated protein (TIGR02619 family)
MPRCVVSTVGTSLLTNGADRDLTDFLRRTANLTEEELPAADRSLIDARADAVADALAAADVPTRRRLSAELNGLYGVCGPALEASPPDLHFLLATDTHQGRATARLVGGLLQAAGCIAEVVAPPRLSTRSQADFAHGVRALITWCEEGLPGYRDAGYRVVFNLVGGFKSLQGYANTIGMFHADEIVYIFEGEGSPLLRIPRLPIRLDAGPLERERSLCARLAEGLTVPATQLSGWPEALWEEAEPGRAWLSGWGLLVWGRLKDELLADEPLELPRLTYATSFRRDFAGHHNRREKVHLQEKLAKAAVLLEQSGGDLAALRRDGGLQYETYRNRPGIGHFRVSLGLRVSCREQGDALELLHFGAHDYVNDNPV